jgi:hypothetical protein
MCGAAKALLIHEAGACTDRTRSPQKLCGVKPTIKHKGEPTMKRQLFLSFSALCFIGLSFCPLPARGQSPSQARGEQAQGVFPKKYYCSMGATEGRYGFYAIGTELPTNSAGLPAGPYSASGILTLDGKGNGVIDVLNENAGGIIFQDPPLPFTYTVESNCAIKVVIDLGAIFNLPFDLKSTGFGVIVDGGNEIYATNSTPGHVYHTLVAKRLEGKN